jgi:hypothetical protein
MGAVTQAVQSYGQRHHAVAATAIANSKGAASAAPAEAQEDLTTYQSRITLTISEDNFDQLEKEVQLARTSKAEYPGDTWKLSAFYEGVSKPPAGDKSSDTDWETHFATLRKWVTTHPTSAAARIATAEAYVNYAWVARGSGYSSSVSDRGWQLFGDRLNSAKALLIEAATLDQKCPEWYAVMFSVALGEGWGKTEARELFDEAAAFEPTFHVYYTEYAYYILPKWYGEEGETQAFAEEVSQKVGGVDGSILYYEIAAQTACQCDKDRDSMDGLSWPRIKQGFEDLKRTYGVTNLSQNRIAYMAYSAGDRQTAQLAFEAIGSDWNHNVWRSPQNFESARSWAVGP